MSEGLNKASLLGNLGVEPELSFTQSGRGRLKLRLATNRSYQDKDGQRHEKTDWHNVIVWGKRAEGLGRILSKGERIYVEGRIENRAYEDDNKIKRVLTSIIADEIILLGGPRGRVSAEAGGNGVSAPSTAAVAADDIPF